MPIQLFSLDAIKGRLDENGKRLVETLDQESQKFVHDNQDDVTELGEDVIKEILAEELDSLEPIPPIPDNATPEYIAAVQEVIERRKKTNQLVAAAQRAHSERVVRVRKNLKTIAFKLASITIGMGAKAVIGL